MMHGSVATLGFRPHGRAFAVKVAAKRLPIFPFSGFDLYHHVRNDAFYDLYNLSKVRETGKREVVLLQPLPQTLYHEAGTPKWPHFRASYVNPNPQPCPAGVLQLRVRVWGLRVPARNLCVLMFCTRPVNTGSFTLCTSILQLHTRTHPRVVSVYLSSHTFGGAGLFSAPKLVDWYRKSSMSI